MTKKYLSIAIVAVGLLTSSVVWAQTTGATPTPPSAAQIDASGITYPIPELGSCTDRDTCRTYCNDPANMSACIDFASKHGLMNKSEASVAKKFVSEIADKKTPGGCTSPESCNAYCQEIGRLSECLSFAKDHGISDDNVKQGEQIQKFLSEGGKMPGECTGKDSCETYCGDFNHVTECTAFAKGAGFLKKIAEDQGMNIDQFQKVMDLTASGQAPGGCKSKDQCDSYCKDPAHLDECLSFGTKAGFISEDQAKKIQSIGGKGPGGCDSEAACKTYCNDPKNGPACFQFGKEHNLIPPEELKKAQDGIVQLKMGLEKAPPEIKACLNSVLGADAIAQIQAGTFMPSPEIGDRLAECADKFKESFNPEKMFKGAPPEVAQCLKEKVGTLADKMISGQEMPDAGTADAFRVCMGQEQIGQVGQVGQSGASGMGMPNINQFLNGAPPEIQSCITDKLGADFADKVAKGEASQEDIQGKMKDCFKSFRPPQPQEGGDGNFPSVDVGGGQGFSAPAGMGSSIMPKMMGGLPEKVLECIKGKLSEEEYTKFSQGQVSSDAKDALQSCATEGFGAGVMPKMPTLPQIPRNSSPASDYVPSQEGGDKVPSSDFIPPSVKVPSYGVPTVVMPQGGMMQKVPITYPTSPASDYGAPLPVNEVPSVNITVPSGTMPQVQVPMLPQVPLNSSLVPDSGTPPSVY